MRSRPVSLIDRALNLPYPPEKIRARFACIEEWLSEHDDYPTVRRALKTLRTGLLGYAAALDRLEEDGWQYDSEKGWQAVPFANRPAEHFNVAVREVCARMGVTSNNEATRHEIARELGVSRSLAVPRGKIGMAIDYYLRLLKSARQKTSGKSPATP